MNKYLIVALMFLITGIVIAITKNFDILPLSYTMIGCAIVVVIYGMKQKRKEQEKEI